LERQTSPSSFSTSIAQVIVAAALVSDTSTNPLSEAGRLTIAPALASLEPAPKRFFSP